MRSAELVAYQKQILHIATQKPKAQRVVRYFPDTHLGNSHHGLREIAAKVGIRVEKLQLGEYAIFVNKRQTALKLFAPGNVVAYLKMPGDCRLDPRVIAMVPKFFNGTEIKYDAAIRELIQKQFPKATLTLQ